MARSGSISALRPPLGVPGAPAARDRPRHDPVGRRVTRAVLSCSSALAGLAKWLPCGLVASLAFGSSAIAQDLPSGGTVSAGAASISGTESTVTVHQASQQAAINWQSFNIAAGKSVTFIQPDANAVALNRVLDANPSVILGSLSANGKVFLVNPNGVLFGQGAQVNVAGLVASTLDVSDADFMAGRYRFSGSGGGTVLNRGTINADGGYVALLGADVSNEGVIQANMGVVALAAGEAITLDVAGDGLLNVAVDTGAVAALARNGGLLRADGGRVLMTAQAAGQLIGTAVNNSGRIEARTLQNRGGVISLLGAADGGAVTIAGTLDASGAGTGEKGGRIVVTAQTVHLAGEARLDASGDAGGGSILVGGGYRGKDPGVAHALGVTMDAGVVIAADAIRAGNGGEVVLWSTGETSALGTITARGGALSGDGGLVETSGAHVVTGDTTRVDTLAPDGKTGMWLLDPYDYRIATSGGDETPDQVTISLASSNRLIQADNDITVADAITWTTPQTLELRAGHDVLIDAAMTASTGGSVMRLTAGRAVDVRGALTASALGSLIEINAGTDINLFEAVTAAGGGAVVLRADSDGTGGPGGGTVRLNGSPVTTTSKTIYYSPENGYGAPTDFDGFTSFMWVFVAADGKVYDGTVDATARFRGDPTLGGADVALTGGTIAFADKNVGTAKPVDFSGYGLTGADAGLFALFAPAGVTTAAITPAALTVTADGATKSYGQAISFAGTGFTSAGLQNDDTIGSVARTSLGAAATAAVSASPYAITASGAAGGSFAASNYAITYVDGALTVTPAALTITGNDAAKSYGQALTFDGTAFTSAGLQNDETIGTVTQASAGAVATANVADGPYAITSSAATGGTFATGNYAITYADGALTVDPATLLITGNDAGKTYGQALTFDGTDFTSTGLQNDETIGTVSQASAGAAATASVADGPYAITSSGAAGGTFAAGNYAITYADGALTVTPAALLITGSDAGKTYGQALTFDGTAFTSAGLQNDETIGTVSQASAGAAATANVADGPYAITSSGAAGGTFATGNYTISYADGALTVDPATLLITGSDAAKTYGQALAFDGTAFTSTGLQNDETIGTVSQASAGAAATASVADGPYAITSSGAAGGTFAAGNYAITYADGALTVAPATLLIAGNDAGKTYGDALTFDGTAFTSAGLQNDETISTVSQASAGAAATANVADGPYAITSSAATGGTFATGNYAIAYVDGALTVAPATLLITGNDAAKSYGQALAFDGTAFTSAGLQNDETIGTVSQASAGAVATANVADGPYAITSSGAAGGTFATGNYAITYADGALTVDPATLVITGNDAAKAYGQALTFDGTAFTSAGLQNDETIGTVSQASAGAVATANVADGPYAITSSAAAGGTFAAGNYAITYADGQLSVTPAALLITGNDAAKTYGDALTFDGTAFTSTGLQNDETIGTVNQASAGAVATASVADGPYAITSSGAAGGTFAAGNYAITYADGALTVDPATLLITSSDAGKTYGQALTFDGTAFTSAGLQNDETIGTVSQASAGAAATAVVSDGPYAITSSDAVGGTFAAANYIISYANGALVVNRAALLVTADDAAKTYGDSFVFAGTEFTASGLQNGETIGSVSQTSLGAVATANVADGPYAITASGAAGGTFGIGNYAVTYADGAMRISRAALVITADDAEKTYGQVLGFDGTAFTSIGLRNADTIGTVTQASLGAAATSSVAGGPYAITASGATGGTFSAANYTTSYADGVLTVTPAALLIRANDAAKTYGDSFAFAATGFTASGLQNDETIGTVTQASAGAAATANVVDGPYAVIASGAAGGSFAPGNYAISYADGALTVSPAGLLITANGAAKIYGETLGFDGTAFTSIGLRNGETIATVSEASAGAVATANVADGPYAITLGNAAGGTFRTGNYAITYADGALTVAPAALLITGSDVAKTYGQALSFDGTAFTSTGLQNDETIGTVTQASAGAVATASVADGAYAITSSGAAGGTFAAGNYAITYADGALTVSPAALRIAANDAAKIYGQTLSFDGTAFTSIGLRNGDTIGTVTQTSIGASAPASVAGGPYAIAASDATGGTFSAANYVTTYVDGALTVTPAALRVTADNMTKMFGDTLVFTGTEFTAAGLQNGDTVGTVSAASAGAAATASVAGGPYGIAVSNAAGGSFVAGNYTIAYADGVLTVAPAALRIAAGDITKSYGEALTLDPAAFTAAGLRNGDTIATVTAASAGAVATASVAGGPYAVRLSEAAGGTFASGNYAITYVDGALTVTPAALLIATRDAAKIYGQILTFDGTGFMSTGLRNGETIGSVSQTSLGAAATANVADGPYAITSSSATGGTFSAGNYAITYTDGALTVTPAALRIAADDAAKIYGDSFAFDGTAFTASGLRNGDTVGSVSQASAGAAATANVADGPYAITSAGAAGGTFSTGNYVITYADGALTVTPADLLVAGNDAAKIYGQALGFDGTAFTSAGLRNGETIGTVRQASAGAVATASVAGGPYAIISGDAAGGTFDPGNYVVRYADGALTVAPAALRITADDAAKIYGQALSFDGTAFTSIGLQNGETIGTVTATSPGALPAAGVAGGPYAITPGGAAGGTADTGNYAVTYADGALTVTPAALQITANDATKTHGLTLILDGTAFTAIGLQNGDVVDAVPQTSAGAAGTASVAGGPYAISLGDAAGASFDPANYTTSYVAGVLTVTAAAVPPVVTPPVETPPDAAPGPMDTSAASWAEGTLDEEARRSSVLHAALSPGIELAVIEGGVARPTDPLVAARPAAPSPRVPLVEPQAPARRPVPVYAPKQARH